MQTQIMKIEYDTTNIDIDDLCTKYGVSKESLDWYQPEALQIQGKSIITPEVLQESKSVEEVKATLILSTAYDVKEKALNLAKDMLMDNDDLSPKDIKDLVAIADSVEAGFKPKESSAPVINVLVQNLMEAKDDC